MTPVKMEWLPVRCCCSPGKVLGFLRVTTWSAQQGLLTLPPRVNRFPAGDYGDIPLTSLSIEPPVVVEIRDFQDRSGANTYPVERAIVSDDRPIEFWREVKGFVEVAG